MLAIFFLFLVMCGLLGLFLAFFLIPFVVARSRKAVREMEIVVAEYKTINPAYREENHEKYLLKLRTLKAKVGKADRPSWDRAKEIYDDFRFQ